MNKLILTARLVKDPELRKSNSNTSIANVSVAYDNERKDANGVYPTNFIDIVAFGSTAEYIVKNGRKGDLIELCGRLESSSYEKKDGNTVKKFEVMVEYARVLLKHSSDNNESTPYANDNDNDNDIDEMNRVAKISLYDLPDDDLPF